MANEIGFERRTKFAHPIDRNDLVTILNTYKKWKTNLQSHNSLSNPYKCDKVSVVLPPSLLEDRLDANYYYARYLIEMNSTMGEGEKLLADICEISSTRVIDKEKTYKYVQFSDVSVKTGEIISHTEEDYLDQLPDRAQMLIRKDDVLCARVFDSEENIALVPEEYDGNVASTGFVILRPRDIPSELLYYYMRLPSTIKQVRYLCRGTILPSCRDEDILKIRIPVISDEDRVKMIVSCVRDIESKRSEVKQSLKSLSSL